MGPKVLIVGAGILGCSIAYQLQQAGARVMVLDAGLPAATPASFGWINASYYLNEDHFRLRVEGIEAYRRVACDFDLPINWSGCLSWEGPQETFEARLNDLHALGYRVEEVDTERFAALEPHLAAPQERCMWLPDEAAAEPAALAACFLSAAQNLGTRLVRGVAVRGVKRHGGAVTGVCTDAGVFDTDHVVLAAGVNTPALLSDLGVSVPMLHRPALVIRTLPIAPTVNHILVSDLGEVRQLPDGSLMLPAAVGHQRDDDEAAPDDLGRVADETLARLQLLFPGTSLSLAEVMLAYRPMPQDGLPVAGSVCEGGYVATMHSAITLGAVMGELVSREVLQGPDNETQGWLAPYRPGRFKA